MKKNYTVLLALFVSQGLLAQDTANSKQLEQVIVTGQFKAQSLKKSVYQVRVVNQQRIALSGATNVQQVLNNQLGFRFNNDNTLGTSSVQLLAMSGRNVKILLDGVPMPDRGDTRESLNQVDVNSIERIEIVEGPMSVSYGSDALAGVINIITKKGNGHSLSVTAKAQEETAGSEYYPFSYKGAHIQNIGITSSVKKWNFSAAGTHNDFDGFGGDDYGRGKLWRPKEQWFGNGRVGYNNGKINLYYRLDGLHEDISDRQAINFANYRAIDKYYITNRYMHQLQNQWHISDKAQLSSVLSYTDYERRTKTLRHDFQAGTEVLTTGAGEQDISKLKSFVFRNTLSYQFSDKFSIQPGIDINYEKVSGDRVAGSPSITDYALFIAAEIAPTDKINIRPGVRFIKNSVYDAPPAIPSINTKFKLSNTLDFRAAYAYGFRAPALRELYFSFHDANHDIDGNPNLKAEHSNSFNASFNWAPAQKNEVRFGAVLGGFYNIFNNQIDLASSTVNGATVYTYFNVLRSKSAGATLENTINWKNLEATVGFSYIGFYNGLYDDKSYIKDDSRDFLWTPEVNSNIIYNITKLKTRLGLFYKYSGKKPAFAFGTNSSNQDIIYVAKTDAYNLADFTITTTVNKFITATGGIKNLFDVTNVNNTAVSTGVHSSNGPLALNYGRSYFLGLTFQWNRK
ncbi:TonB-dependent receptor plug domain-containing protein [Ferruginibacter sp.]